MESVAEAMSNDLEGDFQNAKAFLLKTSLHSNLNIYDHLSSVIKKVLDEKPHNVTELIGDLVRDEKRAKFCPNFDTIQNKEDESTEVALARSQLTLFERRPGESLIETVMLDPERDEDLEEAPLPDLMELANYFEQAGVGIGREETFRIFLALKILIDSQPIRTCRFWGKIFGIHANYFIAEVEFFEGEDPEELSDDNKQQEQQQDQDEAKVDLAKEGWGLGVRGVNYSQCCTVIFSHQVVSYPPFAGNEANYLRAQIARISATTHISPLGYYVFEEEEEEDDEGGGRDSFVVNQEFEGLTINDMTDLSCSNWVHHVQYILPQGRCTWFNPSQKREEEELEEEEDEEEKEEPDEPEPEQGPPLLTPLSEDAEVDSMPPWTAQKSSTLVPQYALAVMHSNLWPGAHAFAVERKFENIYVGWGQRYSAENYSPPPPPPPQEEFPSGPEITEAEDPSVEEEKALKAAQQEALEAAEMEEDEEEDDEDD
ncbi:PREDICTED: radial spoke head protein 4 homolog A-like [Acropora digitifera]|uniref:radial spoke head protein 4 homolog A-like n=1 Tax=Acropora digitifera TaxID=70779 RepID=UPI000779F21E|nr:PREDICTED: radial spoke head protein 4 homolog A-like [Acropora digitifera]